ncbi:MAG: zinc ribbon domain-containing protein [Candidatus Aminicenantales bacterium]
MPIYEYKCLKCGKVIEIFVRSPHETTTVVCPDCGSKNLKKIFSIPAAVTIGKSSAPGTTCCGREERCSAPLPVPRAGLAAGINLTGHLEDEESFPVRGEGWAKK